MANYTSNNFLLQINSGDKVIRIRDRFNHNTYSINGLSIRNILIDNNVIRINTIDEVINLDFVNNADAKLAYPLLQQQLNIVRNTYPQTVSGPQGKPGSVGPAGATGPQGEIGPAGATGSQGKTFTTLFSTTTYSVINTPTSYTFLPGANFWDGVLSYELFDNSQGFYLQSNLPLLSDDDGFVLGVISNENFSDYIIYLNGNNYSFVDDGLSIISSGTYSDGDIFSLYNDGSQVYYKINSETITSVNFSVGKYSFFSSPFSFESQSLANTYTFSNVLFYPTGKAGSKYDSVINDYFAVPDVDQVIRTTTLPNLGFTTDQIVVVKSDVINYVDSYYDDNNDNLQLLFYAKVDSYEPNTGSISLVTILAKNIGLTSSFWYINLSGEPGIQGKQGSVGPGYFGTSNTYLSVPVIEQNVILITQPNLGFSPNQTVLVKSDLVNYANSYYNDIDDHELSFYASVDSYNINTGILSLVTTSSKNIGLTSNSWYINLSGEPNLNYNNQWSVTGSNIYYLNNVLIGTNSNTYNYNLIVDGTSFFNNTIEAWGGFQVWGYLGQNETPTANAIINSDGRYIVNINNGGFGKGTFDTGRSGNGGVSIFCSAGYELNFQAGYLRNITEGGNGTPQPLKIESDLQFVDAINSVNARINSDGSGVLAAENISWDVEGNFYLLKTLYLSGTNSLTPPIWDGDGSYFATQFWVQSQGYSTGGGSSLVGITNTDGDLVASNWQINSNGSAILGKGYLYPDGLFKIDVNNGYAFIGDLEGDQNNTRILVLDNDQTITANANNGYTFTGGGIFSVDGSVSFDNGAITSDGGGSLYASGSLNAGAFSGVNLNLSGGIWVDDGAITSDGAGNILANQFALNNDTAYISSTGDIRSNDIYIGYDEGVGGGFVTAYLWQIHSDGTAVFSDVHLEFDEGPAGGAIRSSFWSIAGNGDANFSEIKQYGDLVKPYHVYIAKLTQSGTSAPVATVFENTIGELTWTRIGVGTYQLSGPANDGSLFRDDNSTITISGRNVEKNVKLFDTDYDYLVIKAYNSSGVLSDNQLENTTSIEIRSYNI